MVLGTHLTRTFILMSVRCYVSRAKFWDIVDSNWVFDFLSFGYIIVNPEIFPFYDPEFGCLSELEQATANEKTRTEINLEALLLPRVATTDPGLSNKYLTRL